MGDLPDEQGREANVGSLASRLLAAALPMLVALFLGSITVGVVGTSVDGPAWIGGLIRAFFALVVGGIAVWCAAIGIQLLRGDRAAGRSAERVPPALLGFCPGCGQATPSTPSPCSLCGHPLHDRGSFWKTEERSWLANLLLLGLGGGLLALGLLLVVGPFSDGEDRAWALVAFVALGLLIVAVGALLLWGGSLVVLEDLFGLARWRYEAHSQGRDRASSATASATLARGKIVHGAGAAHEELSVTSGRSPDRASRLFLVPEQARFVRVVISLYREGLLGLWYERRQEWSMGHPPKRVIFARAPNGAALVPERRSTERMMICALDRHVPPPYRKAFDVFADRATDPVPLADLWKAVRDDPSTLRELGAAAKTQEDADIEHAIAREIAPLLVN